MRSSRAHCIPSSARDSSRSERLLFYGLLHHPEFHLILERFVAGRRRYELPFIIPSARDEHAGDRRDKSGPVPGRLGCPNFEPRAQRGASVRARSALSQAIPARAVRADGLATRFELMEKKLFLLPISLPRQRNGAGGKGRSPLGVKKGPLALRSFSAGGCGPSDVCRLRKPVQGSGIL